MNQSNELNQKQNPINIAFWKLISLSNDSLLSLNQSINQGDDSDNQLINQISTQTSLKSQLLSQLQLIKLTEQEYELAKNIISSLDNDGFLPSKDWQYFTKNYNIATVQSLQEIISRFEPAGCSFCKSDINKSLAVQVKEAYSHDITSKTLLLKMLSENYPLILQNRILKLSKIYKVTTKRIVSELECLKKITTKPGNIDKTIQIQPDIFVSVSQDNTNIVIKTVFDDAFFDAKANNNYGMIAFSMFLNTYKKVVEYIINYQKMFFLQNVTKDAGNLNRTMFLKKLSYKDISVELNISISTVCKIVQNKYVSFENETYSLKSFIQRALKPHKNGTVEYTSVYIKGLICDILSKNETLSDANLEIMLKSRGVQIARRTVAKYRKQVGILNSYNRKYTQ